MATTLLQAVNTLLTRTRVISTDLSALTGNSAQQDVTIAIAAINDTLDELLAHGAFPQDIAEGTLTLATTTREYIVPADFAAVAPDDTGRPIMVDQTNGQYLYEYSGGYQQMFRDQLIPGNYTGLPTFWCINPATSKFRIDTSPTANENGRAYKFNYKKRTNLSAAADTFPVTDEVVAHLIPAAAEIWRREAKGREQFDSGLYGQAMGRAAGLVSQMAPKTHYGPAWL